MLTRDNIAMTKIATHLELFPFTFVAIAQKKVMKKTFPIKKNMSVRMGFSKPEPPK